MSVLRKALFGCVALVLVVGVCGGCSSEESELPILDFMSFPDPELSPYCLPFPVGESVILSQAWGDAGTHRGRFAIDFSAPIGTEITAARGGVVTETRDQYSDSDRSGGHENGVFILHDDGTLASYLHMSEDGVFVSVGDEIETGQLIGLVGTTGTSIPHVHFEVFEGQGEGTQWYRTVPVSFSNVREPLDAWGGLLKGRYESAPCTPHA